MRKMKKLAALILAAIMVLAMGITSFADQSQAGAKDGKITIGNPAEDETYEIYKVFDLTYTPVEGKDPIVAYTYNKTTEKETQDKQYETLTGEGSPFKLEPTGTMTKGDKGLYNVTLNDDTTTGEAIGNWFKKNQKALGEKVDSKTGKKGTPLVFDQLNFGYYYISTTQGTLVTVDSTTPEAKVIDKTEIPTIKKYVNELNSFDGKTEPVEDKWGAANDASIGDTVFFKIVVEAKPGAKNYVVKDQLPAGMTLLEETVKVTSKIDDEEDVKELVEGPDNDYVFEKKEPALPTRKGELPIDKEDPTFTISFTEKYLDNYYNKQEAAATADVQTPKKGIITITYSAKVEENIIIGDLGNQNLTVLDWGDAQETLPETTTTYVWEFNVEKVIKDTETPLADADFSVFLDEACTKGLTFVKTSAADAADVYSYRGEGTATVITTGESGAFNVEGLDSGIYWLKEVDSPAGYMLLEAPIKVEISGKEGDEPWVATLTTVENTPGQPLPTTGGMGTTLFYIVGALLILAGGAIVLKKKNEA